MIRLDQYKLRPWAWDPFTLRRQAELEIRVFKPARVIGAPHMSRHRTKLSTYGHRYRKIRDPVRSPIVKPVIDRLLVAAVLAPYPVATEDSRPRQARPPGPAHRFPTVHSVARPARPSRPGYARLPRLRPPLLYRHPLLHDGLILWSHAVLVLSRPSRTPRAARGPCIGWLAPPHQPDGAQ